MRICANILWNELDKIVETIENEIDTKCECEADNEREKERRNEHREGKNTHFFFHKEEKKDNGNNCVDTKWRHLHT